MLSCCFPKVSPQPVFLNSINNKNTPRECLGWIEKNMYPGPETTDTSIENNSFSAKNLCEYKTTKGKVKHIDAYRLFYTDAQNALIDSGICRSSLYLKPKHFFSWLIYKGTTEQRTQHIFNLVNMEYGAHGTIRPACYYSDNTYGSIKIKYNDDLGGNPFLVHSIEVSKTASISQNMSLTHYYKWQDGGVIPIQDLDTLASEVLKAMQNGSSPVIHCVAGRGRTGVLTVAVILKKEIQGQNRIKINRDNYKAVVCHLVKDLRNEGGGPRFVNSSKQLELLFQFAEFLLT